jgi:hypothetical protein
MVFCGVSKPGCHGGTFRLSLRRWIKLRFAGRIRKRPQKVAGDKDYSSKNNRDGLHKRGITPVITYNRSLLTNRIQKRTRNHHANQFPKHQKYQLIGVVRYNSRERQLQVKRKNGGKFMRLFTSFAVFSYRRGVPD